MKKLSEWWQQITGNPTDPNNKNLGLENEIFASAVTKLGWLAVVAFLIWKFLRDRVGGAFWIGYGVASLVLLWLMTTKANPVDGDKKYDGNLQDYAEEYPGGFKRKNLLDYL